MKVRCDSRICGAELATMEPLCRTKLIEQLLVGRLLRKSARVLDIWERSARDWNQTLYVMTSYAMGAPHNSQAAQELAERVSYLMCLRERGTQERVETMLLGASGLLEGEYFDDYLLEVQKEYDYLAAKYGLQKMKGSEWRKGNFPAGNPVMRVIQMAALVTKEEYSVDALLAMRTLEDVEQLFDVRASDYWQQRFLKQGASRASVGSLGRDKLRMLAINLVVPMQFAYGEVVRNEALKDCALDLLEKVPAEHNRLVGRWTAAGVPARSAYDSQALIELSQLCDGGECATCPLAKQLKKA